jgi:predicted DNA-binding protein
VSAPKPTPSGLYASPVKLVDVVMRLPRWKRDALDKLAADTRVRKSEYLREAIADVLAKHAEKLDGAP